MMRVQQASMRMVEARGASTQASPVVVAILVLDLLFRAHHYVQQVAEEKVRGRQRVHTCLRDGHFLVAGGAPQLQRVPGTALAL